MTIIILFIVHWYVSLFFQTFFNHRYAAHRMFRMSPFWEKVFFVLSWLTNGSSYLSPNAYGIMHRMHHAFADTEKDPHSPKYSRNLFDMMWKTRQNYSDVYFRRIPLEERFTKNVPTWTRFDNFGENNWVRLSWIVVYTLIYIWLATAWWQFLFLPLTCVMGPLHGAVINWFAHKIGYRNFEVSDTSKNILPLDILMLGEGYHNNHHKHGSRANFGYRWFELDPVYPFILLFDLVGIIDLKKKYKPNLSVRFSGEEIAQIRAAVDQLQLPAIEDLKKYPEKKLAQYIEAWEEFVKRDWKGELSEYASKIDARYELQLLMENVSESVREKVNGWVEPLDQKFKEKMKPWNESIASKYFSGKNQYFWETHSILQTV
jgi:stearoyl-CoA desaturase (delta-9 desaturase)